MNSKRVRDALRAVADPRKAEGMRAYMKSAMPYLGVQTKLLRDTCKRLFVAVPFDDAAAWQALVLEIWRNARFREERYAAIYLIEDRRALPLETMKSLSMYEEMIVSGAWWDFVDVIAAHRIGSLLAKSPKPMRRKMLAWSKAKNMWLRRTAILCQLSFNDKTDLGLLYACIEPSLASKEFFLQKAIGWALRQYAWTDSKEIKRYVRERATELSALSKREALKNI